VAPEELGDLRSSDIPDVENVDDVPAPPSMDSGGAGESTESQILGNADEMQ
jgi:hypothetical protein